MTSSYASLGRRLSPNGHLALEGDILFNMKYREDIFSTITESRTDILHVRESMHDQNYVVDEGDDLSQSNFTNFQPPISTTETKH